MVYPWFEPGPRHQKYYCIQYVRERRRFRPQGYCPTRRSSCYKLYYKYPSWYTCNTQAKYRLNIMFRHMPVPRDTSVSRQINIVCCESVRNCQTLSKTDLRNLWIVSYFVLFLSLRPLTNFVPFRRAPTTCFAHCFHLYITWYSIKWLYFRFSS